MKQSLNPNFLFFLIWECYSWIRELFFPPNWSPAGCFFFFFLKNITFILLNGRWRNRKNKAIIFVSLEDMAFCHLNYRGPDTSLFCVEEKNKLELSSSFPTSATTINSYFNYFRKISTLQMWGASIVFSYTYRDLIIVSGL